MALSDVQASLLSSLEMVTGDATERELRANNPRRSPLVISVDRTVPIAFRLDPTFVHPLDCVITSTFGDTEVSNEQYDELYEIVELFIENIKDTEPAGYKIYWGTGGITAAMYDTGQAVLEARITVPVCERYPLG